VPWHKALAAELRKEDGEMDGTWAFWECYSIWRSPEAGERSTGGHSDDANLLSWPL